MRRFPAPPVVLLLLIAFSGCSRPQPVSDPDGEQWWKHVQILASDEMKGRYTGSEEYRKAAAYVADQFRQLGLAPAGRQGYLQPVEFESRRLVAAKSTIEIVMDGKATSIPIPADAALTTGGKSGEVVDAPLVFAGYALSAPEAKYDDFGGLPTQGAVAIRFAGAPKGVPSLVAAYNGSGEVRAAHLRAKGIRGLLTIASPRVFDLPWDRLVNSILTTEIQPKLAGPNDEWDLGPSAYLKPETLDLLLAGTGHTYREIAALDKAGKPLPRFVTKAKVRMKAVFEAGTGEAPNVVAMLPGSDPVLKNEYVVLSAHLDHVGIGEPAGGDSIYNGAMDNASGVATLIEAARILKAGPAPKRSILFLACMGEEEGEKGSLYFAQNPTVAAGSIAANINLDMYLPLYPLKILRAYGLRESDLAGYLEGAAIQLGVRVEDDPQPERNNFIRSDQFSFIKQGIPALFLSFGYEPGTPEEKLADAWFEKRYHGPADDTAQPVDKPAASRFNRLIAATSLRIANAAQRPKWNRDSFFRRFSR